jgi:hypothetical protein
MSKKPGKPMILTDYAKENDDDIEALIARNRQLEDDFDPMYIAGYTEVLKANSIKEADSLDWANKYEKTNLTKSKVYDIIGAQPHEIPLRFTAIRVVGMDGTHNANVSRDLAEYTRWGYKPATVQDHFRPHGFTPPLGYTVQTDGTLRRDDLQLFVVDARAEKARLELLARRAQEAEAPSVKLEKETRMEFEGTTERRRESVTYDTDFKEDNE